MSAKRIELAITKYLTQEANFEDLDLLSEWIKHPENQLLFDNYVRVYYKATLAMADFDVEVIKQNLLKQIREDNQKVYKINVRRKIVKYTAAAILVGVLIGGYLLKETLKLNDEIRQTPVIVNNQIKPGTTKATLTLENGEEITFVKGASMQTANATSNGEEIIYNNVDVNKNLVYNTLTIPRGGQFLVKLSDGTQVWLNSETQLKYPVDFLEGQSRQVELVYGEAYFEVSPSNLHDGADFRVLNNHQEIQVLGTKFNIRSYRDETNILTTLVEGKVSVKSLNENEILKPNQQSVVNIIDQSVKIKEINVRTEIAWLNGEFILKHKTLKEIMRELSRWYDMDVVFENKDLEDVRFVGVLGRDQSIEEILNTIQSFGIINGYEINNKEVKLK